ncbi:MAG: uracil-DNA glycosylase [Planctomycetota bacterium]
MNSLRKQRLARQHLEADRMLGVTAVPVSDQPPAAVLSDPASTPTHQAVAPAPRAPQPPSPMRSAPPSRRAVAPGPTPPPAPLQAQIGAVKLRDVPPDHRPAALAELRQKLADDPAVQRLQPPGTQIVFGEGTPTADIAFIGEGPGENEDRLARPFVGKAGQLLDKMITAMGLDRADVYLSNAVNFRPPGNRAPTPEETAACLPYLLEQLAIVRPKAVVLLGGSAARALLDTKTGITRLRGSWQSITRLDPPLPVMPTFHPAYLLRSYTVDNRKKVWADLQEVLAKVGIKPKG